MHHFLFFVIPLSHALPINRCHGSSVSAFRFESRLRFFFSMLSKKKKKKKSGDSTFIAAHNLFIMIFTLSRSCVCQRRLVLDMSKHFQNRPDLLPPSPDPPDSSSGTCPTRWKPTSPEWFLRLCRGRRVRHV